MTAAEVVLDASALVRGLQRETVDAIEVLERIGNGETRAHAPDLIAAETANALLQLVRAERMTRDEARVALETADGVGLVRYPTGPLAPAALERALDGGITAHDAFYVVLAEALEVPLVTADRRLAEATDRSVLVGSVS